MPGDRCTVGLTEAEYRSAITGITIPGDAGLVVTAVGEGGIGSSSWVFTRLVSLAATLLRDGAAGVADERIWAVWTDPA